MRPRFIGVLGRILAAAVCALAGHIALYQTVLPTDEVHGYLSWYEPAIAGLSLAAVVGLVGLVLFGLLHRDFRLPWLRADRSFDNCTMRLAMSGLAFLLVQETIERGVAAHSLSLVSVADGRWFAGPGGRDGECSRARLPGATGPAGRSRPARREASPARASDRGTRLEHGSAREAALPAARTARGAARTTRFLSGLQVHVHPDGGVR